MTPDYKQLIKDHVAAIIRGKDERYHGLTTQEQIALLDEDCLCLSVWGTIEAPEVNCTLYRDFLILGKSLRKGWPSRGVYALIEHIAGCHYCKAYYLEQQRGIDFVETFRNGP